MSVVLFIYGTLHPERAPAEIAAAARRLTPLGTATIRARVLDLGMYPGAVLDAAAPSLPGELFLVPDGETLDVLDAYEDFRPGDAEGSLFLRVGTTATRSDGTQERCEVYVYNR